MMKRSLGLMLVVALVAGVIAALPARAATAIPDKPNIVDVDGDGNFLNDQGNGGIVGHQGDNAGGPNLADADFHAVWFTNTADEISVHILTAWAPPNPSFGVNLRVQANDGCLRFQARIPSVTFTGAELARVDDTCDTTIEPVEGKLTIEELDDERGITTLTFPLSAHPALATGATLKAPFANSQLLVGEAPPNASGRCCLTAPQIDNTLPGLDYMIGSQSVVQPPPVAEEPPGKNNPPGKGKKKGCNKGKGKGKKKGACPQPAPEPEPEKCAAYVPGEAGKDAETTVLTDAATEAKPVELTIPTEPGASTGTIQGQGVDRSSHVFHNIQIDSAAATAGLYARLEFDDGQDYDLWLDNAAGEEVASSAGFNQLMLIPDDPGGGSDTDSGGFSESNSENLVGIATADCGGYTLDISGFMTEGGDKTLKLWVGAASYTPPATGAQAVYEAAVSLF